MRSLLGLVLIALVSSPVVAESHRIGIVLNVRDAIGPATSDYIKQGLDLAAERGAELVLLQLDTPGGLDSAMRDIIQHIIASPVPVVIFVSPSGARAASAGTYMLYAAHIAAMAPGTNLGAATPVQIGGLPDLKPPASSKSKENESDEEVAPASGDAMGKKMINDAVAYIRSLAEMRGRNADWAEQAVREAASLSAEEALKRGVIDVVASSPTDLLARIDGWTVNIAGQHILLETEGLELETIVADWRNKFLSVITNPNIAYILMLLGIYGLFFELANPGFVLPGVIGGICLLLALYAMQVLPVNYAGLGLILLGMAFMIAELFMPSFGVLGIGGFVAFIMGSIILFDIEDSNVSISLSLIVSVAVLTAGFFLVAMRLIINAQRKPVVTGAEQMLGSVGDALEDFDGTGHIHIHGETWQAESSVPVMQGDKVQVKQISGLKLMVEPLKEE